MCVCVGGGGGGGVDSPPTYQNLDKKKSQKREGEGGLCVDERLLGQFVGGRKVVARSVRERKKGKKERKVRR